MGWFLHIGTTIVNNQGKISKTVFTPIAPFLTKLYDLVSDPSTDEIVRWTQDGSAFRIVDAQRLSSEVRMMVLSRTPCAICFAPLGFVRDLLL